MTFQFTSQYQRKMLYRFGQNAIRQARETSENTVDDLLQMGMRYAKARAPYYTGKTAKLIRTRRVSSEDGASGVIISPNPTPEKRFNGEVFDLVRWMHTSPQAKYHIKSGHRQYMYLTADYLRQKGASVVNNNFKKIFI